MANTYELIKGETLASAAASYSFTAIPSTFTDLVLRVGARGTAGSGDWFFNGRLEINAIQADYSQTQLKGNGSTASSANLSNTWNAFLYASYPSSLATSNTFSNNEIYIANYSTSNKKVFSSFTVQESNSSTATQANINTFAHLLQNTAAITSLTLSAAYNFEIGSSFYLYGIKNS